MTTSTSATFVLPPRAAALPCPAEKARSVAGTPAFSTARVLLVATPMAASLAFGAVQTWAWIALALVAVLILAAWGIGCVRQGAVRLAWSPIYIPAILFLLLAGVQYFFRLAPDLIACREAGLKLLTDLVFFFMAGQLWASGSEKAARRLGVAVAIFAFLLSLFALVQFFSIPTLIYWSVKPRWGGWIFGPYVNHNHYAGLMEMLIPVAACCFLSFSNGHPGRAMLGFMVLAPLASALLSGSRGGFLALLGESLILVAAVLRFVSSDVRRALIVAVALGLAATALGFFTLETGDMPKHLAAVFNPSRYAEKSFAERKAVALDTLAIFRDHAWTGVGLGGFETVYPRYQSQAWDEVWEHAHNDYVEALAETGFAGGVLILAAIFIFIRLGFPGLRERLKHPAGWIQFGAALGCCGLLVHSLFDFNLHIPANATWFAVCAAWGTARDSEPPRATRGPYVNR